MRAPVRQRSSRTRWRRPAGLRRGIATSVLLHLALAALVVIAALQRERPPEPLPPPSYAMYYESGAPERPAEAEAVPSPPPAEAVPPLPEPPTVTPVPPITPPSDTPPLTAPPPASLPRLADPPTPRTPPTIAEPVPPPPAPPRPRDTVELAPEPALPLPPPPAPPSPPRERPQAAPPPAATAQRPSERPGERLPGLYLPDGLRMAPPPRPPGAAPQSAARRPPLDLNLDRLAVIGRASPEPQAQVRGAEVGPDWRSAFRRWLEDNKRYPENARVVGEQGTNRVEIIAAPDGRVRSARLLRQSGSVWLDAGTVGLFRGAVLPAFPPGADPGGVTIDLTINYVLIYQ